MNRTSTSASSAIFRLEPSGDASTFTLVVENPTTKDSQRARLRKEGENVTIFWSAGRVDLLRAPLEPGREWSWEESGRKTDAAIVGIETLSVNGRPTPSLRVRYETRGEPTQEYWFARGIGWVRIQLTRPGEPPDVRELATSSPP